LSQSASSKYLEQCLTYGKYCIEVRKNV
jgi:hypothetical protein